VPSVSIFRRWNPKRGDAKVTHLMTDAVLSLDNWFLKGDSAPETPARVAGLGQLAKALLLTTLNQRDDRPVLVVFGSRAEARNAIDNFTYFAGREAASRVHYLPSIDFDFYRGILPNPELLSERNVGLHHAVADANRRVFVTTVGALLQKVIPPSAFLKATQVLKPNTEVDRDQLIANFLEAGYQRQPVAYDPGVFSVRGGVIDIFSPLYPKPLRLEFFGDTIEEIRFYDPQGQLSLDKVDEARVIPVGQSLIPHRQDYEIAAEAIKTRLDNLGIPKSKRDELLEKVREANVTTEVGYLFPLLSGGSATLFDYFPTNSITVWDGKERLLECAREKELPHYLKNLELFEKDLTPIAEAPQLFASEAELVKIVGRAESIYLEDFVSSKNEASWEQMSQPISLENERDLAAHHKSGTAALEGFARRFREWMDRGYRVQIVCHTQTHADRFKMLFSTYGLDARLHPEKGAAFPAMLGTDFSRLNLWQGYITQSQVFPKLELVVVSEEEIFGQKKRAAKSSAWKAGQAMDLLASFRDLKVNDFVVHRDHGIGKYLGLKSMTFQGLPNDYVLLEYKDGDKLYVPVYRLNVLQKYAGSEGAVAVIDKLGGDRWAKAKSKAERAVAELAAEFLNIQAKRKLLPAHAFPPPGAEYHEFEMQFPFDETPDQMKAIEDVNHDLGQPHPMDRLLCGDVGYGKTEVALRAAFRCALDGRQVAVLVPTTVLAFQHFETFKNRVKDSAIRVEMVSRLKTAAENKATVDQLKDGKVDIIVGTHRLFSADVIFKDLGLVVVDEEHRFGVVHKERLKKMCESVHVLSMTATPIPRTLNMAMMGIKDISIITTPPPDRLAVRTFVCRTSDEVILEAISNELSRDGQVFFVHNRIESIFKVGEELKKLLPRLKLEIVHGQMDGDELEKKMLSFYRGEYHLLLTTAIIESGLDVPRANTMIIDDADHFGLAQLYQLRGRVGRSEKRAYCYLLVPPENQMTADAKQRLQVIQRYTDLGAGFSVASHDLEIRGAGDMLGKEQSGHLSAIGVDLYFELLEESIRALRGEKKRTEVEPEITLKVAAFFPADYLPDISERIGLYRRLSSVDNEEQVSDIESEIRDRFGSLPEEVSNLLGLMTLKIYLKRLHVIRLSAGPKKTSLQFAPTTPAKPELLVKLIQSNPKNYSATPDQKLVFVAENPDWKVLLKEVKSLVDRLGIE
jgi:transcription-repair coupling factor (superfamily II helicase)